MDKVQEIIQHWLYVYNYRHGRKAYASHYCSEDLPYGNFTCMSPHCPKHCWKWENKHYLRMMEGEDVAAYRLILPLGDIVPPPMLSRIWENFSKKLRRRYDDCEWYWVLELQDGNLHFHVIFKAAEDVTFQEIDKKWRATLAKQKKADGTSLSIPPNTVRVSLLDSHDDYQNVASYNVKSNWKRPWEYRPPTGLYKHLAFPSRGFFNETTTIGA